MGDLSLKNLPFCILSLWICGVKSCQDILTKVKDKWLLLELHFSARCLLAGHLWITEETYTILFGWVIPSYLPTTHNVPPFECDPEWEKAVVPIQLALQNSSLIWAIWLSKSNCAMMGCASGILIVESQHRMSMALEKSNDLFGKQLIFFWNPVSVWQLRSRSDCVSD